MIIENQAFTLSYDLALHPNPFPVSMTSCARWSLMKGEGGGAKSYDREKRETLVLNKSFNSLWGYRSANCLEFTATNKKSLLFAGV